VVAAPRYDTLIPTWNNLPYLRPSVESLRPHSASPHHVAVDARDGSDRSLGWMRSEGIEHTRSRRNLGVSLAQARVEAAWRRHYPR